MSQNRSAQRWRKVSVPLAAGIFYLLAACWVCRPLLAHFGHSLPFGSTPNPQDALYFQPADSHQLYWFLWLFLDNFWEGRSLIANPYEFGALQSNDLHSMGLWGFPMQLGFALFSPLGTYRAYNLLVLLSFPLTGLVQYGLLRAFRIRPLWAFVGGFLFAFASFRKTQMFAGHANGFLFFHLPLTCWLLKRAFAQVSLRGAHLAGVSLLACAFGEWHNFYYSSWFFGAFVLFLFFREGLYRRWREFRVQLLLGIVFLWEMSGAAWTLWMRQISIVGTVAEQNRGMRWVRGNSPPWQSLFDPGRIANRDVYYGAQVESALYLSNAALACVLLAFLTVGLVHLLQTRSLTPASSTSDETGRGGADLAFFGATFVVGVWLCLGITADRVLPLYSLLFDYLPYWDLARVPSRISYLGYFGFSFVVAWVFHAYQAWISRLPVRGRQLALGLCIAAVILPIAEHLYLSAPPILSAVPDRQNAARKSLEEAPAGTVLYLPLHAVDSSQHAAWEHYTTLVRKPFINGYAPNAPLSAQKLVRRLASTLNKGKFPIALQEELYALGVRYVLYDRSLRFLRPPKTARGWQQKLMKSSALRQLVQDGPVTLYALEPPSIRQNASSQGTPLPPASPSP